MSRSNPMRVHSEVSSTRTAVSSLTFLRSRQQREDERSRLFKISAWVVSSLFGLLACSFCCNFCGGVSGCRSSAYMTKEDQEDFRQMTSGDRCSINCMDGVIDTCAATCCCGCCFGACGNFGPFYIADAFGKM